MFQTNTNKYKFLAQPINSGNISAVTNNNGGGSVSQIGGSCPAFPTNCSNECMDINSMGCIICSASCDNNKRELLVHV